MEDTIFSSAGSGSAAKLARLAPEHIPALAALERQCFSTAWQEDQFASAFAQPVFSAFGLIEDHTRLLGYISLYHHVDELEILNVAVAPECRRKGYGRRLLALAFNLAQRLSAGRILLEVRPSNAPALALYEEFGFARAGVRPKYYVDTGEDALILAAPVPAFKENS